MTDEEITKYIDMGDIEKDEEITNERAIAELYRWVRVVNSESYEYENLTPKVLDVAIKALQENDFLTFLMSIINPNEMEKYLSMYNAQNQKGENDGT